MNCQQYLFKLTSGQLENAPPSERLQAAWHRMMCRRCRAFTRNNAALDAILRSWSEQLQAPDPQPDTPPANSHAQREEPPPSIPT